MSEAIELKPCPFCGYEPEFIRVHVYPNGEKFPASIRCRHCNYHLASDNEEGLSVRWNVRPVEDAMRAEVERLKAYAMKLLSDETRTWKCKKCGSEVDQIHHGQYVIPAAEGQCPICEDGIMVPKAWLMQEEIDRLRKALEVYADEKNWKNDDWGILSVFSRNDGGVGYGNPTAIAQEALEVKG